MRIASVVAVFLSMVSAAQAARPVGRWDVVADQRIAEPFKAGVVAFHPEGLTVEFRVNGALVATADNPTLNDRVNVWEFWFTFNPADYADGPVTVDARAIPLNGTDPSYDLPSLNLYANSGGSLDVATVKWADAAAGSDSNPGTEAQPYATLAKAVQNTPPGGTIYLKAGTYSAASLGGGKSRQYWTTVAAADGLGWDDVELSAGRPATDRLRLKNLSAFTEVATGAYTNILVGENGATTIWLDNVKMWNKNGRWAASTFPLGNKYNAYTTGGLTTWTREGPAGSIVRNHHVQTIGSDVFTGENRLVVNCTADDVDCGSTGWHPDFHQAYAVDPDWCENMIMYNVKATNCNCQGFFGGRLRDSAFVNVQFERVPDVDFRSQYSGAMINDLWFHVTIVNQSWAWRGVGTSALAADDLTLTNCIFPTMGLAEDATADGLTIDTNHFIASTMGTNFTTGDPLYVDADAKDYTLTAESPAFGTGRPLQCVPADVNGVPYDAVAPNKGCFAAAPAAKPGDANGDDAVNIDDFVILKNNFGRTDAAWADGDFNGDGAVNIDDFVILKNNFGS